LEASAPIPTFREFDQRKPAAAEFEPHSANNGRGCTGRSPEHCSVRNNASARENRHAACSPAGSQRPPENQRKTRAFCAARRSTQNYRRSPRSLSATLTVHDRETRLRKRR
jgi:hypothetical protein